jgi:hypothetical protein
MQGRPYHSAYSAAALARDQSTRFRQGCAFGGVVDTCHPMEELSPKTSHFRDVNGDFQLKRLRA